MKYQALVPLVTYPDNNTEHAVTNSIAIAKLINANADAVVMEPSIPNVGNALSHIVLDLPEHIRAVEARCSSIAADLIRTFGQVADREGVDARASFLKANPVFFADRAAETARRYDIACVGWLRGSTGIQALAEGLLFGSGRPLLLVPEAEKVQKLDHVAVAWDGTRVAARAVADARRILERAAMISVITMSGEKPIRNEESGELLVESLCSAGLNAHFSESNTRKQNISEALQDHAIHLGADILVMGGYGHSRLRNFVLGSATRGVLANLSMPVMLSH